MPRLFAVPLVSEVFKVPLQDSIVRKEVQLQFVQVLDVFNIDETSGLLLLHIFEALGFSSLLLERDDVL